MSAHTPESVGTAPLPIQQVLATICTVKRREQFSDEIRRAVDANGRSRYAICKSLGLAESAMSRFMSGKAGLSLSMLDRLAVLLDLHVIAGKRARKVKP